MASSKLTLDLSGQLGLAPNFAGDLNDTVAQPQLRYLGSPGMVADGIYDPLRVQGYMSPVNNTYTALTGTITNEFISRAYSASADKTYLAQNGVNLSTISGLDGTSITSTAVLSGSSVFKDLEIYQMNNNEAIFYAYLNNTPVTSTVPNLTLGFVSTDLSKGAFQLAAEVFESLQSTDTASQVISSTTNHALGQKFSTSDFFTVSSFPVSGIRLYLQMPYIGVNQTWTLQVSIQTDSGGFPSGTDVSGTVVTMNPNNLPSGTYGYVYFTFSSIVTLTAATTYHIVIQPTTTLVTANQGVEWLSSFNGNPPYPNGDAEKYDGTTWTQASLFTESFDFALVLNQYNYIGETSETINTDLGFVTIGANSSNGHTAAGTTLSFTQTTTVALYPTIVLYIRIDGGSDIVTAVTCGGVAMTLVGKQATSAAFVNSFQYVYQISAIASGSHTIAITTSSSTEITGMSNDYYGTDQSAPMSGLAFSNGVTGSGNFNFAVNVPTDREGSLPVGFAAIPSGDILTAGSGTITRSQSTSDKTTGFYDSGAIEISSGTYALNFVSNTTNVGFGVVYGEIRPGLSTTSNVAMPAIVQDDENTFLHAAQNGFLYWFMGPRVHKFDGGITASSLGGDFTPDVLTFPSYIKTIDAVDTNSLVYIAIESSNTAQPEQRDFPADTIGVYSWDYQSILVSIRNYYPAPGARSIKRIFLNSEGGIRLITVGENGFSEVRGLTAGQFQVLYTLGLNSYPVGRDALDYIDGMVSWLGSDQIIYTLGKPMPTAKEGIYKTGTIAGLQVGTLTSGIIQVGNKTTTQARDGVLISYKDSTSGNKLVRWYPHGVGTINSVTQQGGAGNVYTLVMQFPTLAKINYIRIYHAPVGTASTTVQGTIKSFVNQSTTAVRTDNVTAADIIKGYQYIKLGQALQSGVFALQFLLTWPTNTTLSTSVDWMPRFIEVDYEELTKLF